VRSVRDLDEPSYRGGSDFWDRGAGGAIVTTEFFGAAQPPLTVLGGRFFVRLAGAWVAKPLKVSFQGEWRERLVRRWSGTQWLLINPNPPPGG
jgi:hypothetical protein